MYLATLFLISIIVFAILQMKRTRIKRLRKKREQNPFEKVIFLDFDGVLHRGFNESFEHIHKFEKVLRKNPHVSVVISSDWRRSRTIEQLKDIFPSSVRDQIIGKTAEDLHGNRQKEIDDFCKKENVKDFLIIDDSEGLFDISSPNLFITKHEVGLTDDNLIFIEKWMRGS